MAEAHRACVLIIDDDLASARLQQRHLERAGFSSHVADTLPDALDLVAREPIELILLDYRLAHGRNGLDIYAELRGAGVRLPTILVTGFSSESVLIQALRAGVRDIVPKADNYLEQLTEAVERAVTKARMETRLAQSEARFATSFHCSPIGITIATLDEGRFIDANQSFCQLLGRRRDEVIGCRTAELGMWFSDEQYPAFARRLQAEQTVRDVDLPITLPDNSHRTIRMFAELIDLDDQLCVLAFYDDVTRRNAYEATLVRQALLFDNLTDAVIITNEHGQITDINRATHKLLGYGPDELLGKSTAAFHLPAEQARIASDMRKALIRGRSWRGDVTFVRKDNSHAICETVVLPIDDAGQHPRGMLWVNRDITALRQQESDRRWLLYELTERVKEFALLENAGQLLDDAKLSTRDMLRRLVDCVPPAFRVPEATTACIRLGEELYPTRGFRDTPHMLSRRFLTTAGQEGEVTVAIVDMGKLPPDQPFLEEEHKLIGLLSEMLLVHFERHEARQRLWRIEQRFRSLTQVTTQLVWFGDAHGRVVEALPEWLAYTGQRSSELRGLGWLSAVHFDEQDATRAAWQQAVAQRAATQIRMRLRRHDGAYRNFEMRAAPMFDDTGRVLEWIAAFAELRDC